jgi:hypothetical protein
MKKIIKIVTFLIILYLLIGIIFATFGAINYDSNKTSYPNNTKTFILNALFWTNKLKNNTYFNKIIKASCTEPEGRTLEKNDYAYPPGDTYGKADICLFYTGKDYPISENYIPGQTEDFKYMDPTCNDPLKCYVAESQCLGDGIEYKIKRCPNCSRGNCFVPDYYKYFIIDKSLGLDIKSSEAILGYNNLSNYIINYTNGSRAQVLVLSSEDEAIKFYAKNTKDSNYKIKDGVKFVEWIDGSSIWQIGNYYISVSSKQLFDLYFNRYLNELNKTQ